MIYETFNPKIHDIFKVSELIYEVDYRTFDLFFKNKKEAIIAISKDLKKRKTNNKFKVILNGNNQIIGFISIYDSEKSYDFRFKNLKLFLVDILDYFVLSEIKSGDLYLAEIAVDKTFRGNGVGSEIIMDVIDYAKSKNYKRVTLDADLRNDIARKLYEKLGFETFDKKRVKIFSFERGMYNMELIL